MQMWRWAVLAAMAALATPPAGAIAQRKLAGDPQAGRTLSLEACTGCHVVAPHQPFRPIYRGAVPAPAFQDIANRAGVTAASLLHDLQTMPTIPKDSQMANADLTDEQARDVAAYIISLRAKP